MRRAKSAPDRRRNRAFVAPLRSAPRPVEIDVYQALARRTLNPALDADARLLDAAAGLSEEAGELLGAVRKHLFQQRPLDRDAVTRELGDALWCLSAVATSLGISLGDVAHGNLDKLRRRFPEGFTTDAALRRADEGPAGGVPAEGDSP
ncbi:MAG: nucleoside triphosphate pyrophosphohydrolase family protein [Gemmatimonadota bacterium]